MCCFSNKIERSVPELGIFDGMSKKFVILSLSVIYVFMLVIENFLEKIWKISALAS